MSLSCGGQIITDQNTKGKKVEKLKILQKLQRAQQLMLRGETAVPYELVDEVIVEILDERHKDKEEYLHTYGPTYE